VIKESRNTAGYRPIYTAVSKQDEAVVLGAGETSGGNLLAVESGARLMGWERNFGWVSLHASLLLYIK
jgi:hypothetical protein